MSTPTINYPCRSTPILLTFLVALAFAAQVPAQPLSTGAWSGYEALVGDVNGDGRSDLIWNETTSGINRTYVGLGQTDGSFKFRPYQDNRSINWSEFKALLIGDVNGDGRSDLIWNEMTGDVNRIVVGFGQETGSFEFAKLQEGPQENWSGYIVLIGDVNGDGLADLIWNKTTSEFNRIQVGISLKNGAFKFLPQQHHGGRGWSEYETLVGDVDGDGRSDLIWNETTGKVNRIFMGISSKDGAFEFPPRQEHPGQDDWSGYKTRVGDVNGDGRVDLIWNLTDDINRIYVGLSGSGGKLEFLPKQDRSERSWFDYKTRVGHVNGDDRADLIWNETTSDINRTYVGLAQSDGTFLFYPSQDQAGGGWSGYETLVGDVNGDRRSDLIWNYLADINRTYVGLHVPGWQFLPLQDHP